MDTPVVQPPAPPTIQPVPPPPKKNSGVLIGLLLFFLGILVGLALGKTTIFSTRHSSPFPSPTPTQKNTLDNLVINTNGIITFQNKIRFRLPDNWNYNFLSTPTVKNDGNLLTLWNKIVPTPAVWGDEVPGTVNIFILDQPGRMYENSTAFKVLSSTIPLDGIEATKQVVDIIDGPQMGIKIIAVFINNGDIHVKLELEKEEFTKEFDQILSTFKFTQ